MRRLGVVLMMLCCLFLTSCKEQAGEMQQALDLRRKLAEHGGCTFTAEVEADYGDGVYAFTLGCAYDGSKGALTVTAPEEIRNIKAVVSSDGATLEFDGARLEYGELANGYIAPLSVPWLLGTAWKDDYISHAGQEEGCCVVTILHGYDDAEVTVDTWLKDGVPVCAVVSYDGRRALAVQIESFAFGCEAVL